MIKPTVGRIVWFTPHAHSGIARIGNQPLAAIITGVWSDCCINVAVFDANGITHSYTSQLLVQEGNARPDAGFCEWMPYQKGQAARTEQAEAAAATAG